MNLEEIVDRFDDVAVLVVGDVMMDEFVWGQVSRISPEAPVPVVDVVSETFVPGGAANVAANIRSLDGTVYLCGLVGQDGIGRKLRFELEKRQIQTRGIITDASRPTILKTRIIAQNQQVVRVDREKRHKAERGCVEKILEFASSTLPSAGVVVISDYGKGVVTEELMQDLVPLCKEQGRPILVDPKVQNLPLYKGATIITPNLAEASQMSGLSLGREENLQRAASIIKEKIECESVLITRGAEGMSLFGKEVVHVPAMAKEVYDVTGAGDTVVACLALALAAGASLKEAVMLANCAAGIVVGKVGTATASREELCDEIKKTSSSLP